MNNPDAVSLFFLLGITGSLMIQPVIYWVSRRLRTSFLMIGGYIGAAASMAIIWIGGYDLRLLMIGNILFGMTSAFPANLIYVYAAELSDNLSEKYGYCFGGVINSILQVSSKIGYVISGSIITVILRATSYIPNVDQTEISLFGIHLCFLLMTILTALLSAVFAYFSFRKTASAPEVSST
jgi:Na+/melibiose symporter-like transporter